MLSKARRFQVFCRDGFTYQYCGLSAPFVILEVDHVYPVSRGGSDDEGNLVTACRDCNRGKRDQELPRPCVACDDCERLSTACPLHECPTCGSSNGLLCCVATDENSGFSSGLQ